jgi:FemAB-related protein (PEP-CTERM system-associated)
MLFPADYEEWDKVVCDTYPLNRFFIDNNIRIKLYSPDKRPVFLANAPYLEEGGIVFNNEQVEILEKEILNLLNEHNLNYILLKSRSSALIDRLPAENIDISYYTFLLDVSLGIDDVWQNKLKSKTRNQIRKAEKHNFNVKFGGKDLLNDFYGVISKCWRDLGTPVHNFKLFELILDAFENKVCLVVLYDQSTPVSTALLFNINGVLSHPFAGTINEYKPSSVNNLLYWNIIKFACDNGIKTFDMGRSRLDQGTYKFKKSWGGIPENIYYYYFLKDNVSMPSLDTTFYKVATSLWKKMPIAIANRIGPKLIYKII